MSFADFERQGRAAQAAGGDPRPHRRPHRLRLRADRRVLPGATGSSCSRTAPTPTAPSWNGRRPGGFGDAGVYSFYATKTVSTGEGGVLVSADTDLIEFARKFRNYGKFEHEVDGLNFRMSEFTAALGLVQAERMEEIVAWKNEYAREHLDPTHPSRLELPEGMTSGLYKYVVFDEIEKSTGRVYEEPCHRIMGRADELPNTDWVAREPLVRAALLPAREPRGGARRGEAHEGPGHRRRRLHRLPRRRPPARPRHHAADLRPQRLPVPLAARGRDLHRQHHRRRQPRPGDARLRRRHPPRRGRRRLATCSPTRCSPRRSTRAAPSTCSRPPAGPRSAASSTARRPGSTATASSRTSTRKRRSRRRATSTRRPSWRGRPTAPATPSSTTSRRTVLRFGIPYGPRARAAGVVAKFTDLAFEGKALTIAGDGSTTRSFIYVEDLADGIVAALSARGGGPHLQPLRRRGRDDPRNRRAGAGKHRQLRDRPHAAAAGGLPRQGRSPTSGRSRSSAGRRRRASAKGSASTSSGCAAATRPPDPMPGKRPSLNGNDHAAGALLAGAVARRGAPAPGAGPDRRHRRGARPAGADHQGRPRRGDPGRRGRDRERPRGDGEDLRLGPPQRLQSHLPLDALAVRHPVLADHQVRADPLALPPPRLLARRPRPAAR